jgi:hypothetical protein
MSRHLYLSGTVLNWTESELIVTGDEKAKDGDFERPLLLALNNHADKQ